MSEVVLVVTVAAQTNLHGTFTPGYRLEQDADGRVWRTDIGMDGQSIGERREVAPSSLAQFTWSAR